MRWIRASFAANSAANDPHNLRRKRGDNVFITESTKSDVPTKVPAGLTGEFADDPAKQRQWVAFLRKSRLEAPDLPETAVTVREALTKLGVLPPDGL